MVYGTRTISTEMLLGRMFFTSTVSNGTHIDCRKFSDAVPLYIFMYPNTLKSTTPGVIPAGAFVIFSVTSLTLSVSGISI